MKRKFGKLITLLLALVMILSLAACKDTPDPTPSETPPSDTPSSTAPTTSVSPPPTTTPDQPPVVAEPTTLVVGYNSFNQVFSPFFASTAYDVDVASMTQVAILGNDRGGDMILKGIKGEKRDFNGTEYLYTGIGDIDIVEKADGKVDYNITIRDDIYFSDGVKMTIDDAIFSFYAFSDTDYDGSSTFYAVPVTGMQNYRAGVNDDIYTKYETLGYAILEAGQDNTDFSGWTAAQQNLFWTQYLQEGGEAFAGDIVNYCVSNYPDYLGDVNNDKVSLGMYLWGFADFNDAGLLETLTGVTFDIDNEEFPTLADYWFELFAEYGLNFSADDGLNVEAANNDFEYFMVSTFISGEGPKDAEAGGEIMNIAGIKKTGDYSMTITTDWFEATSIYQIGGMQVTPLHYYGDKSLYDYNKNMFGFPKGDLTKLREKTTVPMGAGAYKYVSYQNGVVTFEANERYYKGAPKTTYILFQESSDEDLLAGVISGTLDISDPSFGVDRAEAIKSYNSNGQLSGDKIVTSTVDFLGYRFLGISADNVNVGGNPSSEASKNLRRALATLYSVYRETVIYSYYRETASVIQYPISNTSWAAPRPNDEGYEIAYSKDVNGKPIYNDSMTEEQKYDAALQAAIGFFKAAGYTWDDAQGKFTAAPEGAKMVYECGIPGDGKGDHPVYGLLTNTKEALAKIGITLEIFDPAAFATLTAKVDAGNAEMWTMSWQVTIDPDMYQLYHSSNRVGLPGSTGSNAYSINDPELDELIMDARASADNVYRKSTYKHCMEIIMEWAVEVPIGQVQQAVIFSPERIKMETITPDITTFWTWMNDIELIEVF